MRLHGLGWRFGVPLRTVISLNNKLFTWAESPLEPFINSLSLLGRVHYPPRPFLFRPILLSYLIFHFPEGHTSVSKKKRPHQILEKKLFTEPGDSPSLPSRPEQGGRRGGDLSHRLLERRRRPTDAPTASSALARWAPALAVSTHSVCSLDLLMCYEFDCYPCVPQRHYFLLFHGSPY
jgi:hypothetical protein